MPTLEDRIAVVEKWMKTTDPRLRTALGIANALEGRPSDATLSLPHNDSWLFEDNVDSTHPANLRYVIAANTQRIVSARLTIHLAPYRTYNSLSFSATGAGTAHNHSHGHTSANHAHTIPIDAGPFTNAVGQNAGGGNLADAFGPTTAPVNATTPANTGTDATNEASHTHPLSGSAVLGVTEGATASGVTVSFDGVDQTVALGGPFNADVIELNVRPYLGTSLGVLHTIAMQPSGLGRIEAHLRLGVYVSAGQLV